jgi:hypothetical protein
MEPNPYEPPQISSSECQAAPPVRAGRIVALTLIAIVCAAIAAFGFAALYPWSEDPLVNPFTQALAIMISMTCVGFVTFATIGVVGWVYLLFSRKRCRATR